MSHTLPEVRGSLSQGKLLSELTWLRVGGPADWLFNPADVDDLAAFLAAIDPDIAVFPMGVGSNLIVRDGGLRNARKQCFDERACARDTQRALRLLDCRLIGTGIDQRWLAHL